MSATSSKLPNQSRCPGKQFAQAANEVGFAGLLRAAGGPRILLDENSADNMVLNMSAQSKWVRYGFQAAGISFCLIWACALGAFPLLKENVLGYVPIVLGLLVGWGLYRVGTGAINSWLRVWSPRSFWTWVIVFALVVRLSTLLLWPTWPSSDAANYHAKAMDIFNGQGYGPTAYWPVGLPMLLAVWYHLTLAHPVAGYVLGVFISTATIFLAHDVGRRVLSNVAARWMAILTAIMPTLVFTAARTDASALLVFLVLAIADLVLIGTRRGWQGWTAGVAAGGLLGYAVLVKPVCLLVPVFVLISWLSLTGRRAACWRTLVCVATMTAVIAPWTLRNYRVLGTFVLVSTNGGVCLYTGVNPDTNGMYSRERDPRFHPLPGEVDEISVDRIRRRAALKWIKENPLACCKLMLKKQAYMWGTSSTNIAVGINDRVPAHLQEPIGKAIKALVNLFWAALLVLVLIGTLRTTVWQNCSAWLLLLMLLYMLALHSIFEVQSRYHIPVISALLLVAAAGLAGEDKVLGKKS